MADLWVNVCVWCLCVSLSWDKEGPGSGPRHGTPKTTFCPHALLPTDKQRLIFERNEAAAAVDAEAAVVLRSEAAAAFAAYIAAEAAATAAKVRCVEAAAAAAAHDEAAVVRRVQNKTLEPKLAAYNVEREQTKLAGMLSDDLLEGASVITGGARGGEQGGIEASSADMLYLLLTCITCC